MVNPLLYAALVVLIACSAFFSATETAFSTVSRIRLRFQADNGDRRAKRALRIIDRFDDALSAILIGNNIVNISATAIATVVFTTLFGGSLGPTISTIVMTLLVLTFGEILPKSMAKEFAEPVTLAVSSILWGVMTVLKPLVWFFVHLKALVMRPFRSKEAAPTMTEEELKYMIGEIGDEGVLEEHESELLQSAMEFTDITVSEIITHRVDVVAVDIQESSETVKNILLTERFARLPVYDKTIDNILGIINDKDFFRGYVKTPDFPLKSILQDVLFVPPKKPISEMLKDFQKSKTQMAIVTDQFGGTLGIVTVEDIVEELVGEIWDEDEEIVPELTRQPDGSILVSGDMKVEDLFSELFPDSRLHEEDSRNVSGWVMEELDKVPEPGEQFRDGPLEVTVRKVEDQRVIEFQAVILPEELPQEDEDE